MSTKPRVSSAITGEPAHLGSVLMHHPALATRFGALYGQFWQSDVLSARVKEITRMRNARINECGFCRNVRFDKAIDDGLSEDAVDDITDGYEHSDKFIDAEKAALKFTDALIHDPSLMDVNAQEALKRHFTNEEIAEMGMGVTLFVALAKALVTMGLEPEEMSRTVLPAPAPSETSQLEAAE